MGHPVGTVGAYYGYMYCGSLLAYRMLMKCQYSRDFSIRPIVNLSTNVPNKIFVCRRGHESVPSQNDNSSTLCLFNLPYGISLQVICLILPMGAEQPLSAVSIPRSIHCVAVAISVICIEVISYQNVGNPGEQNPAQSQSAVTSRNLTRLTACPVMAISLLLKLVLADIDFRTQ